MARLTRLKEQADDMRHNIVRVDPFKVLTLETMTSIMKFGLDMDRYFVLKCSWVNQKWRDTLTGDCPELWGILTIDPKSFKDKTQNDKRNAWISRAGLTPHTVKLQDMVISSVSRIPKSYDDYMSRAKTIMISVKEPLVLARLADKWEEPCDKVQHLSILGGYAPHDRSSRDTGENPPVELHCGLLSYQGTNTVRSIELKNVDYKDRILDEEYGTGDLDYMRTLKHYPFLTRLTLENCAIPNVYRPGVLGNPGAEYQFDVLHRVLRRAPSLEYLKVVPEKQTYLDGRAAQPALWEAAPNTGN